MKINYVFFGTPEFAAIILDRLVKADMPPPVVVCAPDKPVGRKHIVAPPPVKARIMNYEERIKNKIKVLQPEKLDEQFRNSLFLIRDSFDVFVVAAYAKILSENILAIPRLGTIGCHPSFLPKYRGVSPIQSAILNDEQETGAALFLMDKEVDHGPILRSQKLKVKSQNYKKLTQELAELSGNLLIETLPKFIKGEIKPVPQNENEATYTKKFSVEDALIDLKNDPPRQIWLKIRALNPEPGVVTFLELKNGKKLRLKLLEADLKDDELEPQKVQPEGKKPMTYKDFLNGYKDLLAP